MHFPTVAFFSKCLCVRHAAAKINMSTSGLVYVVLGVSCLWMLQQIANPNVFQEREDISLPVIMFYCVKVLQFA